MGPPETWSEQGYTDNSTFLLSPRSFSPSSSTAGCYKIVFTPQNSLFFFVLIQHHSHDKIEGFGSSIWLWVRAKAGDLWSHLHSLCPVFGPSHLWLETCFLNTIIKSSSGGSLQVGEAIYSLCHWETDEVPSEWPHQPFLLGDGGTMAIGSQLKDGSPATAPEPPQLFRNVMETNGTCHLFSFLLTFRCLPQHPCPQSPGSWGGLRPIPRRGGGERGGPAYLPPASSVYMVMNTSWPYLL